MYVTGVYRNTSTYGIMFPVLFLVLFFESFRKKRCPFCTFFRKKNVPTMPTFDAWPHLHRLLVVVKKPEQLQVVCAVCAFSWRPRQNAHD